MRADKLVSTVALILMALQSHIVAAAVSTDDDKSYLQPVITSGVTTLGSIEKMQGENMLLEMKVKTAQLKRQLKENGLNVDGTEIKVVSVQKAEPTNEGSQKMDGKTVETVPQVTEISGQGKKLVAVLSYSNGRQVEIGVGQHLPGTELTVTNITETKILLSDGSTMGL